MGKEPVWEEPVSVVRTLCEKLFNVTIVLKGENDIISDGRHGRSILFATNLRSTMQTSLDSKVLLSIDQTENTSCIFIIHSTFSLANKNLCNFKI